MALGEGQLNPSTSGDAGGDHNEDYGNKDCFSGCAYAVEGNHNLTPDSKKQYSEKELKEEVEARLARILGAQNQGTKHDKKRKKSTDFPGYLGSQSTFDKAKKHKKRAEVPSSSSSSSSDCSSDSSEEDRKGKKRNKKQRHKKGKKTARKSKSRRDDDSSTDDTSTDSSDSEDGHFYANKKNFYKANQYDFLEDEQESPGDVPDDGEPDEQPEVEENKEILVPEHILAHKDTKTKGKVRRRFLVKFKNYPALDAKWMEEEDLADTPQILKLYLEAFGLA
ncbi:hypothetical protein L7F22_053446 [Adiantum nelumboides]|nr:hypothetical protein [Adiantum nelumboides]